MFAGIVMILVGVFEATAGLVALFKDRLFAVRADSLVLTVHYTTWGWLHLVLGLLIYALVVHGGEMQPQSSREERA